MDLLNNGEQEEAMKVDIGPLLTYKVPTRSMPNLNSFPMWREEKKSKMYLTEIDPPNEGQVNDFRDDARRFLTRWGPSNLVVPDAMAEVKTGSSFYYDNGTKLRDSEKPHYSYHGPFKYQRFMTGPLVEREVWLPSKAYKMNSSWWHMLTAPILEMVPHVVCNDARDTAALSVARRFKPCKTIDLRGCGLQYPREYIQTLMEVIFEMYPDTEIQGHLDIAKQLFSTMSIEVDNNKFVQPKRGVGLGYFNNLMTLCTAIMLDGTYIIKMFSDDILIDENDYDVGIEKLNRYSMIVNEDKSGVQWKSCALFAGVLIFTDPSMCFFSQRQAVLSALFTKRYHWERKSMCSLLEAEVIPYIAYHYERIFGFEFFSGESLNHPDNLGINSLAFPIKGWTSDHPLNRMTGPKKIFHDIEIPIPFVGRLPTREAKELHMQRKAAWKRRRLDYNHARELIDPIVEPKGLRRIQPDIWSKSIPMWAEQAQAVWAHRTTRKWVCGLSDGEINDAIGRDKYAKDPYRSYASGGYTIVTAGYEERPAYDQHLQVAELMKVCKPVKDRIVSKTIYPVIPHMDDWFVGIASANPDSIIVVESFTSNANYIFDDKKVKEEIFHQQNNVDVEENLPVDEIVLEEETESSLYLEDDPFDNPNQLHVDWDDII
jgi:hypothetical protein